MKTIRHFSLIAGSVLVLAVMAVTIPSTLAQASRIDGVTPSELTLLQVHLKRIFDKKTH